MIPALTSKASRAGAGKRLAALAVTLPLAIAGFGSTSAIAAPDTFGTQQAQPQQAQPDAKDYPAGRYIVILAEEAAAAYEGGTEGIGATKPQNGRKVDALSQNFKNYDKHLRQAQKDLAGAHGVAIRKQFTTALNGFAAQLSTEQAMALAQNSKVLAVAPDTQNAPDYTSNDFMGLSGKKGAWKTQFGGIDNAGKGVVVGVIDTGYAPDNPFLAGAPVQPLKGKKAKVGEPYLDADGKIAMLKADGTTFKGECQKGTGTGASFDGSACNTKVLSARYFADAYLATVPAEHRAPEEVISPVDIGNHGTHTATTAAGNANVPMTVGGTDFGTSSGVAPAAKVSVYKTCWEDDDPNTGGCYSSAAVDAIDAAIKDGVDVLNYSISGSTTSTTDPVSLAFLNATSAGVFVSVSAGNSGPTVSTVNHSAPWLTTVAASTFPSDLVATVKVSDGSMYRGASVLSKDVTDASVVIAADAAAAGAVDPNLCGPDSLDPAKVSGKVVVCDRGVVARTDKSVEVKRAGGVGMILVNLTPSSEDSDLHAVPTIHVNAPDGPALKAKLAANPALKVSLLKGDLTGKPASPSPQIAGFSSRGPSLAAGGDLLKPDVAAPGVNVLAGVSTVGSNGEQFGFMSGTSMASPHIAGVGALLLGKNPTWSAATVKSAIMTTAYPLVNADGTPNTNPFDGGAGHVNTAKATDPGLVYDAGTKDWLKFLNAQGVETGKPELGTLAAKDANVPSIALGSLVGEVSVKRQLTALEGGRYTASVKLPGVNVTVKPSVLDLKKGQKAEVTITFKNATAALGKYTSGSLSWTSKKQVVTSPIAVRPVDAKADAEYTLSSQGGTGSGQLKLISGSDAPVRVGVEGLVPLQQTDITKTPGALALAEDAHNAVVTVTVPAGATFTRLGVKASSEDTDWDMAVVRPDGKVTQVATSNASEVLELANPAPGTYKIYANLYATPGNVASSATIQSASLAGDAGNLTVTPNPLTAPNGSEVTASLNWSGLSTGSYLGRLSFGPNGVRSLVTVNVG